MWYKLANISFVAFNLRRSLVFYLLLVPCHLPYLQWQVKIFWTIHGHTQAFNSLRMILADGVGIWQPKLPFQRGLLPTGWKKRIFILIGFYQIFPHRRFQSSLSGSIYNQECHDDLVAWCLANLLSSHSEGGKISLLYMVRAVRSEYIPLDKERLHLPVRDWYARNCIATHDAYDKSILQEVFALSETCPRKNEGASTLWVRKQSRIKAGLSEVSRVVLCSAHYP